MIKLVITEAGGNMRLFNVLSGIHATHNPPGSPKGMLPAAYCAVFFLCAALALCLAPVRAHAAAQDPLAGEAFTASSRTVPMPPGWVEAPIKYEDWAVGADLAVTLDQHLYGAFEPLIREYARKNGLRIAVNEGTCGISAGMLSRKAVDIGGFCCPPGESDRLPGVRFHTVGIAALAIIVNPENPTEDITRGQVRSLFMGEHFNWSGLRPGKWKGPELTVRTIGRLHCKARPGHWRLILDNEDLFSIRLQEVGTIPDMIALVSSYPGAIGYEVLWMVRRYESTGKVKTLKVDGVSPEDGKALVAGKYPFYRTLNITTWEQGGLDKPEAVKLKDFIMGSAAGLDPRYGIVPAAELRRAGWKFKRDELAGDPGRSPE